MRSVAEKRAWAGGRAPADAQVRVDAYVALGRLQVAEHWTEGRRLAWGRVSARALVRAELGVTGEGVKEGVAG